jgi:hypothetical protein
MTKGGKNRKRNWEKTRKSQTKGTQLPNLQNLQI